MDNLLIFLITDPPLSLNVGGQIANNLVESLKIVNNRKRRNIPKTQFQI